MKVGWRHGLLFLVLLVAARNVARAEPDPVCAALWTLCRDGDCDRVKAAYEQCPPPTETAALSVTSDLAACRARIQAGFDAASVAPPDVFRALGVLSYDPEQLRLKTGALLSRYRWSSPDASADAQDRLIQGLCQLTQPFDRKDRCTDAGAELIAALKSQLPLPPGVPKATPSFRALLGSADGAACLQAQLPPTTTASSWRYVLVIGREADQVTVFQAGAAGAITRVYRALPAIAVEPGVQLTVIALPQHTAASLRVTHPARGPLARVFLPLAPGTEDVLYDTREEETSCMRVSLALPVQSTLVVDGTPIHHSEDGAAYESHELHVSGTLHEVSVVEPGVKNGRSRAVPSLEPLVLPRDGTCRPITRDLGSSDEHLIALLPFEMAAECASGGINEATLRSRFRHFFRRRFDLKHYAVRDVDAVGAIVSHVSEVDAMVSGLRGRAHGPDRGEDDSRHVLYGAAKEMLRQGFSRAISASMHCSRTAEGWEYTVTVQAANLQALREKKALAAHEWDEVFPTSTRVMTDRRDLYDGVVAPLATVLRIPHVRFLGAYEERRFSSRIQVPIETYKAAAVKAKPVAGAQLQRHRLALPQMRVSRIGALECQRIEDGRSLRAAASIERPAQYWTWDQSLAADVAAELEEGAIGWDDDPRYTLDLDASPGAPGRYLLELYRHAARAPDSLRCLTVTRDPGELFASVSFRTDDIVAIAANARAEQSYARGMLLLGWERPTGWGLRVGGSLATRDGLTPPSFAGLGQTLSFDARGNHEYRVVERSLLIGGSANWNDSVCAIANLATRVFGQRLDRCAHAFRSWHLLARLSVMANFGFVDLGGVDPNVFRADRDGELGSFNFDFAVLTELGTGIRLAEHHNIRALFSLFTPKIFDLFGGAYAAPIYDGRISWGLGLEYARTL